MKQVITVSDTKFYFRKFNFEICLVRL